MNNNMPNNNTFSKRFVAPLYMGSTLNAINTSLLATALVPIATFMKIPVSQTTILVTVLYLASSIAQPTAGKLAEAFGPRKIFLVGILIVLLGGLIGGFGENLFMLIVSRVLIGLGTSTAYPSAMVLIRRRAEFAGLSEPPSSVLGALQIAGIVTSVVGLPIGGVLVYFLGWRTTFFINIPFALITLIMALFWVPRDVPAQSAKSAKAIFSSIDGFGIIWFAATMISLLAFLFSLPDFVWIALVLTVIFGAFLIWWELRKERPFIDVRLLGKNMALSRTYIRLAGLTLCVYTVLYGLTEWLEAAKGLNSSTAGLLILPMSVISAVVAALVSRRNMVRSSLILAAGFSIAASVGVLFLSTGSSILFVVIITLLFGVTMGTMVIGNQTVLYMLVPANQIGTASGLFRTAGYIGSIASSATISVVFNKSVSDSGLHVIAITMIVASALALLLTVTDRWVMASPKKGEDI
jgi:MFS family permease